METLAYFINIQKHLLNQLRNSNKSIYIAVAWFTDPVILNQLELMAIKGIRIIILLMDDEINKGAYGLDFSTFINNGGEIIFIKNEERPHSLMHNKFCIIDEIVLITGSYNWSKRAKGNHENVVVIKNNSILINEFKDEFKYLVKKYSRANVLKHFPLDYRKILVRLDIIKNAILVEDEEDIFCQLSKLNSLIPSISEQKGFGEIKSIVGDIQKKEYLKACQKIDAFRKGFCQVQNYQSPELFAIRLEEKILKIKIITLEEEKLELSKTIRLFNMKHDSELGGLILKILKFQKEKYKEEENKNEYSSTEFRYNEYKKNIEKSMDEKIIELNSNERERIRMLFRKAVTLCHPDKVNEDLKKEASEIFVKLTNAYEKNNIAKVELILEGLEKGIWSFNKENRKEDELSVLKAKVDYLKLKVNELKDEIINIKASAIYMTISVIEDWDEYFNNQKEKLKTKLELLKMN